MSNKLGTPILKGMSSGRFKAGDAHINAAAAAAEALADDRGIRRCSDPDYRPELTKDNLILYGCRTADEAQAERQKRIEEYNSTAKRKIRSDSPVSCVGIIKPGKELIAGWPLEAQIEFLKRAFDETLAILGKTPENVIYAVIHLDEGNPHIHYEVDGRTADGRWSTTPMFQLKTKSALNNDLPIAMFDKYGYVVPRCYSLEPHRKGSGKKKILTAPEYKQMQDLKRKNEELNRQIQANKATIEANRKEIESQAKLLTDLKLFNPQGPSIRLILVAFLKWLDKKMGISLQADSVINQYLANLKNMENQVRNTPKPTKFKPFERE